MEEPAGSGGGGASTAREHHGTHVTDLPAVVLSSILARLTDPADIACALCTCRLFCALVRTAPFRLRLRHASSEDGEPASARVTPGAALASIRTHMRATRALDLSGCYVSDDDVRAVLADCRSLERLVLDNCQKLTSAVADALAASVTSGPCSVSLQRCFGLRSSERLLVAAAGHGSRMRTLQLSHVDSLDVEQARHSESERGGSGSGLRVLALNNCARLDVSGFVDVAVLCRSLEALFLGGSVQALRDEAVISSAMVRAVELLPRLRVLELTFFAAGVVNAVREEVQGKAQVWDLCEESSVAAAARCMREDSGDVAFGLRGAANCSDARKRTPLHVAASLGDEALVTGLLAIGAAAVGMKDASGSTALFVAAESGFASSCALLLQGGADVLASNRAGETPLYIAALRGHAATLSVMLAHCRERGINWHDADAYGDGWTPLMAAAVADRRHEGEMLLQAAGFSVSTDDQEAEKLNDPDVAAMKQSNGEREDLNPGSTSQRLRRLLNRQNRYGQTALHIAAQKGSVWFIDRLLRAGASVDVANAYGFRAVDVATRYKHTETAAILREWESSQWKVAPKKPGRKARRNRNKAADSKPTLDGREAETVAFAPDQQQDPAG